MLKVYMLAGLIATSAAGGGWVGWTMQDGKVQRARYEAQEWRKSADKWQTSAKGWEASWRKSEALRADEHATAVLNIDAISRQCADRVKALQASHDARSRLNAKPVKTDGQGCVVREIWTAKDLAPVLQAGWR